MNRIIIILIVFVMSFTKIFGKSISLWDGNKSDYSIVISSQATTREKKVAGIFQEYFKKKSNITIPIILEGNEKSGFNFYLGKTKRFAGLTNNKSLSDEGYFIGLQNNMIIVGGKTPRGTENAIFGFLSKYLDVEMLSSDYVYCIPEKRKNIDLQAAKYYNPSFQSIDIFNGQSYNDSYTYWHGVNHLFKNGFDSDWGIFGHSFFKILPPSSYQKKNPDYYTYKNNQPSQLNIDNPEVVTEVITSVRRLMAAQPTKKMWMIGQEDDGSFSDLKIKSGTNITDNLIVFINKIADAFPDKIIGTFSFQETQKAPLVTKPRKNVLICFAPIDAIYNIPIYTGFNQRFSQELLKWKSISDNLMVWEYVGNYSDTMLPYPSFDAVSKNLPYYYKNGVKRIYIEGINRSEESFSELYTYLFLKQYWDISSNPQSIMNQFCIRYYGKAAPYILQYINAVLQNVGRTNGIFRFYDTPRKYVVNDFLVNYDAILEQAALAVKGEDIYQARVNKIRAQVDFQLLNENIGKRSVRSSRFLQTMKSLGVSSVKSSGKSIKVDY